MKNLLKYSFIFLTTIAVLTSCVDDSFDEPKKDILSDCQAPTYVDETGVTKLMGKTIEVTAMYALATNPIVVGGVSNAPIYINNTNPPITVPPTPIKEIPTFVEGYIVSSDEAGNFYKNMYIQPLDGSMGFNLSIDEGDMYNKGFYPGRKVYLKLNGLAYAEPTSFAGGLTFGAKPTDIYWVDRLAAFDYKKHLFASCEVIDEDKPGYVPSITIAQATASNNVYLNKLVDIVGVQFKAECSTYSSKSSDTSLKLVNSNTATQTLDLRTSKYATFAGNQVPIGNGKIRGVLTKYGSTYQIVIRSERDVKLTNPRVGVVASPPKIGSSANIFNATLNENFTSYTAPTNDALIPKYINQVEIGSKYWDIKSFGTNKYLQTSAFNNGCVKNYFVVPVNFTTANSISFKTLDGYNNGVPLKVYYSTTYTPGMNMSSANLVDISTNFTYADGRPATLSSYASTFTPSGAYTFPTSLTGNGYIIFEYDGTNGTTTTYQIDDIVIN